MESSQIQSCDQTLLVEFGGLATRVRQNHVFQLLNDQNLQLATASSQDYINEGKLGSVQTLRSIIERVNYSDIGVFRDNVRRLTDLMEKISPAYIKHLIGAEIMEQLPFLRIVTQLWEHFKSQGRYISHHGIIPYTIRIRDSDQAKIGWIEKEEEIHYDIISRDQTKHPGVYYHGFRVTSCDWDEFRVQYAIHNDQLAHYGLRFKRNIIDKCLCKGSWNPRISSDENVVYLCLAASTFWLKKLPDHINSQPTIIEWLKDLNLSDPIKTKIYLGIASLFPCLLSEDDGYVSYDTS